MHRTIFTDLILEAMTIKEELKKEVKEQGGGQDELEALDALEREAAEYNKVCFRSRSLMLRLLFNPYSRMLRSTAY